MSIYTSHETPIRIFIGSSPKNYVEEAVFKYSVQKYSKAPIEFFAIDGKTGSVKNLLTQQVKHLPENLIEKVPGATAFSLARWAIPEWCNYQGKAIYCDSDQVVLADILSLWEFELDNYALAAVPVKEARSQRHYRMDVLKNYTDKEEGLYLASVMLINCELATTWNLEAIVAWKEQLHKDGNRSNLMWVGQNFRERFQVKVKALPPEWNHLDWVDSRSKLVHFTDLTSQPWKFHHNPVSYLWEELFLEAIDQQFLSLDEVEKAHDKGWVSQRIVFLAKAPKAYRGIVNSMWRNWKAFSYGTTALIQKINRRLQALNPKKHKGYA